MTIFDVGHYTDEQRAEMMASWPPHEREARGKGIPQLGSGRIYPVSDELITIEPFQIPDWMVRIVGIDFGIDHPFAAIQLVEDRDENIVYATHEYKITGELPPMHAATIKRWGLDLAVSWPGDGLNRDKASGTQLRDHYQAAGLNMLIDRAQWPDGSVGVEAGLLEIYEAMKTGGLKIFSTLSNLMEEIRLYHRKDGKIVKERDDLLDALRYAWMMRRFAQPNRKRRQHSGSFQAQGVSSADVWRG